MAVFLAHREFCGITPTPVAHDSHMKLALGCTYTSLAFLGWACATNRDGQAADLGVGGADADGPSVVDRDDAGVVGLGGGSGVVDTPDKPTPNCTTSCKDFPAAPLMDDSGPIPLPSSVGSLFGKPADNLSGGPCVLEPSLAVGAAPGALLPANWLRPRVRFNPAGGEDVFEIRFHTEREANDLVVYTTNTTWAMPKAIWQAVAQNVHREPIVVTIRGLHASSPGTPVGTRGSFQIAPVNARGSLVYWATTSTEVDPDTSKLVGFAVGDEGVVDALTVDQVGNRSVLAPTGLELRNTPDANAVKAAGHVQCIGCHVSTPDGDAVAFTDLWPWNGVVASVKEDDAGALPDYVTGGAARLLGQPWLGMMASSKGRWSEAQRLLVSSYSRRTTAQGGDVGFDLISTGNDGLAWFNLAADADVPFSPGNSAALNQAVAEAEGTAWGRIALNGETRSAIAPTWSHDGDDLVYTSADVAQDGRIGAGNDEVDLHRVPFNAGQGGAVKAVEGAAEPGVAEYYPSFSADDQFLAFNRLATLDDKSVYYRPEGEIFVVRSDGSSRAAIRLAANEPVACSGETSPGVINSWAKWSPSVIEHEGKKYYFLVFSSARAYPGQGEIPEGPFSPPDRRMSQLYMATIVEDVASGDLETFDAVYLWNQVGDWSNLTPAWDVFQIPLVEVK